MNHPTIYNPPAKAGPYPEPEPPREPCPPFDRGVCIDCLRPIPWGKFCKACGLDA
jgi:hypothetical protein